MNLKIALGCSIAAASFVVLGFLGVIAFFVMLTDPGVVDKQYTAYASLPGHRPPIPVSSRNIRTKANVDLGKEWVAFEYDPIGADSALAHCTEISRDVVKFPLRGPRKFGTSVDPMPWWPSDLLEGSSAGKLDYVFYRCEEEPLLPAYPSVPISYLALCPSAGKGFWWRN